MLCINFETGAEATAYLKERIQNKRVGLGDSRTLQALKVYEALEPTNKEITDIHRPLERGKFPSDSPSYYAA